MFDKKKFLLVSFVLMNCIWMKNCNTSCGDEHVCLRLVLNCEQHKRESVDGLNWVSATVCYARTTTSYKRTSKSRIQIGKHKWTAEKFKNIIKTSLLFKPKHSVDQLSSRFKRSDHFSNFYQFFVVFFLWIAAWNSRDVKKWKNEID